MNSSVSFAPSAGVPVDDPDHLLLTEEQAPIVDLVGLWALIYRNRVTMGLIVVAAIVAGLV